MEKEIEEELQRLRKSNAFKDKLLAILAHDLKSPLNNIKGTIGLLQDESTSAEDRKELIDLLLSSVNSTTQTLENILDWASQKYYGNVLNRNANELQLNLHEKVNKAIAYVQHHADSKQITVVNNVPEHLKCVGDKQQLLFILRNLISNAIKFSYTKQSVIVQAQQIDDAFVEISVIDYGVGMSKERMGSMFSIEKRFSQEGTGKEKGSGLALILCKDFVEANGGKLTVQSNEGFGTAVKFTIYL